MVAVNRRALELMDGKNSLEKMPVSWRRISQRFQRWQQALSYSRNCL